MFSVVRCLPFVGCCLLSVVCCCLLFECLLFGVRSLVFGVWCLALFGVWCLVLVLMCYVRRLLLDARSVLFDFVVV